ncbi:serine hydrolase [Virgibacillus siamensis]|uniref:serine hydrolase n=1 Tax=Virgibacillus siamensis TaxID=480071 RepID=UPI00158C3EA0|nr:serine hydrolase [Virgibacillus siamensis]
MGSIIRFSCLQTKIRELLNGLESQFSLYISTKDGDIKISENVQRPAASLAKIPILIEALRQIDDGRLREDCSVPIKKSMLAGGAGIIAKLTNADRFTYRDLLELMIIISDNTAANVVLEAVGAEQVNRFCSVCGCNNTILQRKFMDEAAQMTGRDNYTSAEDMMRMLHLICSPNKFISRKNRNKIIGILSNQQLKDKLAYYLPEDSNVHMFHKSGELAGVEHEAAILEYNGNQLQAVVLSEGWENNGDGKLFIAEIGRLLIRYIQST